MAGKPTYEQLEKRIHRLESRLAQCRRHSPAPAANGEAIHQLLSATPIGIGVIENRVVTKVNTALVKLFGYDDEKEMLGKDLQRFYPSEAEYRTVGRILENGPDGSRIVQTDAAFKRKDGTLFQGHLKISVSDPSIAPVRTVFSISDISWRKKAEQEQMEREKLLGVLEMAGAVCHEINQPLQIALIEYSELLETPAAQDVRSQLGNLKHQLDTIGSILHKLMRVTRYKTRDYIKGKKIIDIDRASSREE